MHQSLSADARRLGMKRRAVAGYLASVIINRDPETFMTLWRLRHNTAQARGSSRDNGEAVTRG
jgi:hypothetical protein